MASIPENVRVLWPSSATTPTGWTTDTDFNDKMPYGANSGSGTGGNDVHGHPGNSHSHPGGSHSHSTGTLNKSTDAQSTNHYPYNQRHWYTPYTYTNARCACHTHGGGSIGSANTGGSSGATSNYGNGNHLPAYYTFRVIKSDGSGDGFPAGSVVLWNTASNPTTESGWSQHGGSAGKFIRAASNGGSAAGGSSHQHSGNSHSHGGGGGSHTHSGGSSPTSNSGVCTYQGRGGGGGGCEENIWNPSVPATHTHSIPGASGPAPGGTGGAGGGTSGGATPEPPYISVWGVTNSSDSWLEGGIAFISGESVPDDWVLCNGSNGTPNLNSSKYIKLSSSGGAVGGTGNSTSHNHSNPGSHNHGGSPGHTHTVNTSGTSNQVHGSSTGWSAAVPAPSFYTVRAHQFVWPNYAHSHPLANTTTNSAGANYSSGTSGISSGSHGTPAYKTVNWIMAPEEPSAGGNVGMFGANF